MRTQEERLSMLHKRAGEIRRQRDRRQLMGWGGISACLSFLLVVCVLSAEKMFHNAANTELSGSSLLGESAGGYVLAAVIAFFAGVIITALIFRYRKRE